MALGGSRAAMGGRNMLGSDVGGEMGLAGSFDRVPVQIGGEDLDV
jgi:hypothetical protein